jgi:hypothetical protein
MRDIWTLFQLHREAHVSPCRANRGKSVCDYFERGARVGIGDEVGAFGDNFQGWLLVSFLPRRFLWGALMKDAAECLPAQADGTFHPSPA